MRSPRAYLAFPVSLEDWCGMLLKDGVVAGEGSRPLRFPGSPYFDRKV